MSNIKDDVILYLKRFEYISLLFGEKYLYKIMSHYYNREKNDVPYYHISNFIAWSYTLENKVFFNELEEMLKYFHSEKHLQQYILNPKTRNKLKSMDKVEFHSIWSEIIFAYHLYKSGLTILKIGQVKGEATEKADIITNKGLFEVTTVLSDKDRYEVGEVFWGSNEIIHESKKIINDKIKDKKNQNEATNIVIDCTFMDDITEKLLTSTVFNFKTDFNVFKKIPKNVFIFTRNNVTQQVAPGLIRKI